MTTIRAHYDGAAIVRDETVELPINQPLQSQVIEAAREEGSMDSGLLPEAERERRRAAWERFLSRAIHCPDVPLEALRRENLYEDRL